MATEPINDLAQVIHGRISNMINANSTVTLDFGDILEDYSLKTTKFPKAIPKTDYHVLRHLTLGATGSNLTTTDSAEAHEHSESGSHSHSGGEHDGHEEGSDGSHSHSGDSHSHGETGAHSHSVLIPEKMRWLMPGDRVLVAWLTESDAVVIDIVYKATVIG